MFPEFSDCVLSTRTYIIHSNMTIDICKLYDYLPITPYILVQKKRGRKKKIYTDDPNNNINNGSIITILNDDGKLKGVDLKKKRKEIRNVFRNSVTIVMIIDHKKINFKISKNGTFQMTGCKSLEQSKECIKKFWSYIQPYPQLYMLSSDELVFYFKPVLCNIGFSLGFMINREKLDKYVNCNTNYRSIWGPSFGYAGVNIKLPNNHSNKIIINKLTYKDNIWNDSIVPYKEYITMINNNKEDSDKKFITFLVFHSGKVNMSSDDHIFMKKPYYEFLNIITECKKDIEEKIES